MYREQTCTLYNVTTLKTFWETAYRKKVRGSLPPRLCFPKCLSPETPGTQEKACKKQKMVSRIFMAERRNCLHFAIETLLCATLQESNSFLSLKCVSERRWEGKLPFRVLEEWPVELCRLLGGALRCPDSESRLRRTRVSACTLETFPLGSWGVAHMSREGSQVSFDCSYPDQSGRSFEKPQSARKLGVHRGGV